MGRISVEGNLFTANSPSKQKAIFIELSGKLAASLQEYIIKELDQSVQLATLVGQRPDQEALRTIWRSLKVNITNIDPMKLEAVFEDDYSHWYSGEILPEEIGDIMRKIIEAGIDEWFNTKIPGDIIKDALVAQ